MAERKVGPVLTGPNGEEVPCVPCCESQHPVGTECDECPFQQAGEPGDRLQRLFYASAEAHPVDHKHPDGAKKWHLDRNGIEMAFNVYEITEKPRAYELLQHACAVMNGDEEPPEAPEET